MRLFEDAVGRLPDDSALVIVQAKVSLSGAKSREATVWMKNALELAQENVRPNVRMVDVHAETNVRSSSMRQPLRDAHVQIMEVALL